MSFRFLGIISLAVITGLVLGTTGYLADRSLPPPAETPEPRRSIWEVGGDGQVPFRISKPGRNISTGGMAEILGDNGFSLRYLNTFGTVERAYLEDSDHLNFPYGIWAEGSEIWLADSGGNRALRFTTDGTFLQQIGRAGFPPSIEGIDLEWIADVSLDANGNIWMVDKAAHHLIVFDPSGQLVDEWGEPWVSGTDNTHFSGPESVAFDSDGNVYVSDTNNHRLQVLDPTGGWIQTYGITNQPGTGDQYLHSPAHITVDSTDLLYIADSGNHRIQIYDVTNPVTITLVTSLGITGVPDDDNDHFHSPSGVFVDASYIYVADQGNSRIQVFDRITRAYVASLQDVGSGGAQFVSPTDVAVDGAGNIFVVDQSNSRIQQFDAAFQYIRTYGTSGLPYLTDFQHFNRPGGVAIASDNSVYIVENYGNRLLKLNLDGSLVWSIGEAGVPGSDVSHFNRPTDVALDANGKVYVVDRNNHRVQVFDSSGFYQGTLGTGPGSGDGQLQFPRGIAIGADGTIYIADTLNHRIEIFDSSFNWTGRLGQTGVPGPGEDQFFEPFDVEVDSAGYLYVADHSNHRIQVFDNTLNYVRRIGETGVPAQDFDHLDDPTAVVVDAAGRAYVADNWGGRIQVFDSSGAYLTTLGNSWGNRSGDVRQVQGLALDNSGNLYIAESLNHRVQVFAPGVPGWRQDNINGFGDPNNYWAATLVEFQGHLYTGAYNLSGSGAQLWRQTSAGEWEPAMTNGFGHPANDGISSMVVFQNHLYAGTENHSGAEIWQSEDGISWVQVAEYGFGGYSLAPRITAMTVFDGMLYAATGNWLIPNPPGVQVWRTGNGVDWEIVVSDGFGDPNNSVGLVFEVINGALYIGTRNEVTGGELWRSQSGESGSWAQVNDDGFGDTGNTAVTSVAFFNGSIYAGTRNWYFGAEIWQSLDGTNWTREVDHAFGRGADTGWVDGLVVYHATLYAVLRSYQDGAQVWRSPDGQDWAQINPDGWGDNNNPLTGDGDTALVILGNDLYFGTLNTANGGEVWVYTTFQTFLPMVHH